MSVASASWIDRVCCVVRPRVSRADALELARAECERRGCGSIEPVHVHRRIFGYWILTNADRMGGNISIVIDNCTGHVRSFKVWSK